MRLSLHTAALILLLGACPAVAGHYAVVSASDSPDLLPGDGICEASDLSGCTLRAAVEEANLMAGPDTIVISAVISQIALTEGAVLLSDSGTVLRGESQSTAIDGLLNIGGEPLLRIAGNRNQVISLTLKRSRTDGILITGSENVIGGPDQSDAVIVIQNGLDPIVSAGIRLAGAGAAGNTVEGCSIGTDLAGLPGRGNQHGVIIEQSAASTIVTTCHISGNSGWGVMIRSGARDNIVRDCAIGVDASGLYALANGEGGVLITSGASANTIGSFDSFPSNIIAGNGGDGVCISGAGTSGNVVVGSVIGLDATAQSSLGNQGVGVRLAEGCRDNFVGGADPVARNLIGGNWLDGVRIEHPGTESNRLVGNWIGLAVNAFRSRSNGLVEGHGVTICSRASYNEIGGTLDEERNVIAGERAFGVLITDPGTSHNRIRGNYIGINPTGQYSFYNGSGVVIQAGASHNIIGGDTPADRNVISGSANQEYPWGSGVTLIGDGTTYNSVQGNYIGLEATGSRISPNATAGVMIGSGASYNLIGGDTPGAGNVISGNGYGTLMLGLGRGVHIEGAGTRMNTIAGNLIGTAADGATGLRNFGHGLAIVGGATENLIGGTTAGSGNTIAFNRYHGIFISDAVTRHNSIRQNAVFNNDSAAIVLAGGAQDGIGPPVIQEAISGIYPLVHGFAPGSGGVVDLYRVAPDPTGAGEPKTYLGSTPVYAPGGWYSYGLPFSLGDTLTAIYTDQAGNSSACAQNYIVSIESAIDDDPSALPQHVSLSQNYPNPFNPATEIAFSLPAATHLSLRVFNVTGQEVAVLAEGTYPAGDYRVRWDARDDAGNEVASGVYFYRLATDLGFYSRKMLLVK